MSLNHKESRVVAALVSGEAKFESEAFRLAGFTESIALNPTKLSSIQEIRDEVQRQTAVLVQQTIENSRIDAGEIHDYLTQAIRAKMSDIRNDDGSFKPLSEWPDIWQQMAEGGDVDIEYASERSHDGETRDKDGGWDIKGKIVKVKYKFAPKSKLWELAMKHRGVNAMVQDKAGDTHIHLHAEITAKLQSALARKNQLTEARNVTP